MIMMYQCKNECIVCTNIGGGLFQRWCEVRWMRMVGNFVGLCFTYARMINVPSKV